MLSCKTHHISKVQQTSLYPCFLIFVLPNLLTYERSSNLVLYNTVCVSLTIMQWLLQNSYKTMTTAISLPLKNVISLSFLFFFLQTFKLLPDLQSWLSFSWWMERSVCFPSCLPCQKSLQKACRPCRHLTRCKWHDIFQGDSEGKVLCLCVTVPPCHTPWHVPDPISPWLEIRKSLLQPRLPLTANHTLRITLPYLKLLCPFVSFKTSASLLI